MHRRKLTTLSIGSLSSSTLRTEDLLPAFLSAAEDLRLSKEDRRTVNLVKSRLRAVDDGKYGHGQDLTYWESCDSSDDLTDIAAILENHTPDYCYFGSAEGDGAEFGVWPDSELLTGNDWSGCVFRLPTNVSPSAYASEDADHRQEMREFTHALEVSDHGNATLYRRAGNRWIEVWSIV